MILTVLEETVGLVHHVSAMRTDEIVHCHIILQSPDKSYGTVSYRKDLKDVFAMAAQNKSSVKMTAVKGKPNYFDKTKTNIEATNNTTLEILEKNGVKFEFIKYEQIDQCPLVDVATIL